MTPTQPETNVVTTAPTEDPVQALAKQPGTIKSLLQSELFARAVAKVLPKVTTPERFIRVALTALMRTPDLADCTRESLFRCLLDLSALGIEPDGRRAHLIPFRNNKTKTLECTLIVDYKGLVELVRRSGIVSYIHADVVCEKDEFEFRYGTDAFLKHKPAEGERGRAVRFYSYVRLRDGSEAFEVLNRAEVDAIRKRSKAGDSGPWVTDYNEMGKKTAFRRHSKWLPLSPEISVEAAEALARDDGAIDAEASETWAGLLTPGDEGKRVTARDVVMQEEPQP